MSRYEYTVIPAPVRGDKAPGAKTPADRFALTFARTLNDMATRGWEYVRAEVLPSEERSGLTGRTTAWNNLLVFRRPAGDAAPMPDSMAGAKPVPMSGLTPPSAEPVETAAPTAAPDLTADPMPDRP